MINALHWLDFIGQRVSLLLVPLIQSTESNDNALIIVKQMANVVQTDEYWLVIGQKRREEKKKGERNGLMILEIN